MPEENITLVAVYEFNPSSPDNPLKNHWNADEGEVIVDDFQPGRLSTAVSETANGNDGKVQSIIVAGPISQYDWGVANSFPNCTILDLSRTYGMTYVPSWNFSNNTTLTKICLPSSIERIEYNAFMGCTALNVLNCHATTPPVVVPGAFDGVQGLVVHVPANSVALYQEADVWKDFTILPFEEEVSALEVNFPAGVNMSDYKDMFIELVSITNGQKLRYVVTERISYTFNSLIHRTSYVVRLVNSRGDVLGEIGNIDIVDKDVSVTFSNLRLPQNISIQVLTPDNSDVTSDVVVTWTDANGAFLVKGSELNGQVQGSKVTFSISLPQSLGIQYVQPKDSIYTVLATGNIIKYQLAAIPQTTMAGQVLDVKTSLPLSGATVAVSQTLNGQYSKTLTAKTDGQGRWSMDVFDAPTEITASMTYYVSQSLSLDKPVSEVPTFQLKDISGTTIAINLTYTTTDGNTTDFYSDYANVAYAVYDVATGQQITDLNIQYPQIVLMEQHAEGTAFRIVATSKKQKFEPVEAVATVDNLDRATVTLPIKSFGGIVASFSQAVNTDVVGILYDAKGNFLKKYNYATTALTINELRDGDYTLVTMGSSTMFNSIYSLSQFAESGLTEGTDYVVNNVTVVSGEMAEVSNDLIPFFDETKLYYTGNGTSFTVNKSQVTAGQYLTLSSHLDFRSTIADKVGDVQLIVNLPENSSLVDNSVMVGNSPSGYTYADHVVTIPLSNYSDRIRFCIIPSLGGEYNPTASVQFMLDGESITQPIGNVNFEVKNLSINVPEVTNGSIVFVSGTGIPQSKVEIYDNDKLIAQTVASSYGNWSQTFELSDSEYNYSYHSIYAKFLTQQGIEYLTESKQIILDKTFVSVESVEMLFGPYHFNIEYNKPSNQRFSYTYPVCGDSFTYIINFTNNNLLSVSDVKVNVLCMDKSVRTLKASYDEAKQRWIAHGYFTSSSALPINFNVEYHCPMSSFDDTVRQDDESTYKVTAKEKMEEYAEKNIEVTLLEDGNDSFKFSAVSPNSSESWIFSINMLDKSSVNVDDTFSFIDDEEGDYYLKLFHDETAANYSAIIVDDEDAFEISMTECNIITKRRAKKIIPKWMLTTSSICEELINGLIPYLGYINGVRSYEFWVNKHYPQMVKNLESEYDKSLEALNAKCANGEYRLEGELRQEFFNRLQNLGASDAKFFDTVESMAELWKLTLFNAFWFESLTACLGKALKSIPDIQFPVSNKRGGHVMKYVHRGGKANRLKDEKLISKMYDRFRDDLRSLSELTEFMAYESVQKDFQNYVQMIYSNQYNLYADLRGKMYAAYNICSEESKQEFNDYLFPNPPMVPNIDPSGYVYEAIPTNRVEGATASIYYKEEVEDMYGVKQDNVVLWNAEEYAQKNPLFTDENGMYQWDVPQGLWQVKFEKEGYETAYSEWLPVPPPQLDVNVELKQNKQPEVKMAHAYEDAVEVEFDKYMMPELLTTNSIKVMANGQNLEGTIELLDEAAVEDDDTKTFASKLRFNAAQPFDAEEITLVVNNQVKSYAGIRMQDDYLQTFTVEPEIKEIVCEPNMLLGYGDTISVAVDVLPVKASAGKTLMLKSSSPVILSTLSESVVIGEDGKATFRIGGELPGTAGLTYTVDGYDITATTTVNVSPDFGKVTATPVSNIVSGSLVSEGTFVTLTCSTQGATIYYTLDGSCPCDETKRIVYDGTPIVVDRNVVIKAIAVAPNMEDSEIMNAVYIVLTGDVNNDKRVGIGDIVAVTSFVAGDAVGLPMEIADVNRDGKVGIGDVIAITNIVAGNTNAPKHRIYMIKNK